MIPFASRSIDRENRRTRPIRGLVHTPATPPLHHLGGTNSAASLRGPVSGARVNTSHLNDDARQTPKTVTHVAGLFRYPCSRLHL